MRSLAVSRLGGTHALAERVSVADRFWTRTRGLLGRQPLQRGEGLLLSPCKAVHTVGLRYAIDVAFLDASGTVVAVYRGLEPNRRTRWHALAQSALELPAGTLERTELAEGQRLSWGG
jgi:uncharacterized membrane protein (UPF0127 family)